MISLGKTRIMPIGCSCISQFQIQKHFVPLPTQSGFFDWNIATPAASAAVMDAYSDGSLLPKLVDRAAYFTLSPRKYLMNGHFPGLYFWHEPSEDILDQGNPHRFEAFCDKLRHMVAQSFKNTPQPHLIWSNTQPNLQIVTARVSDDWAAFGLSVAGYDRLTEAAAKLFSNPHIYFAVNEHDCAPALLSRANVYPLGLPRCAKYVGPKGHYGPIFRAISQG